VRHESTFDVPTSLVVRQPTLPRRSSCPRQTRPHWKLPETRELGCQLVGSVMPAFEPAIRIGRNEDDTRSVGLRQRLADDGSSPAGEPTQTALLPGGHKRSQPVVVGQCRAGPRECEPPARTLATTLNRPGGRRAATLAERLLDAAEGRCAPLADLRPGQRAEETPLRQEQIEHVTTLVRHL
jgi:hypothetical protein